MNVNREVEARLREAFSAVIGRDRDRLDAALGPLDPAAAEHALHLALFVCAFITRDVYRSGPVHADYLALGDEVARAESSWSPVESADVAEILRVAVEGDTSVGTLSAEEVPGLAVVAAGHLLAAYRTADQQWWQYLDEILDAALRA